MDGLNGRAAIITGAASPIGSAIARELHARGVQLMLGDLEQVKLSELADELGAQSIVGDLGDEATSRQMIAQCMAHFGRIDILVNNAGMNRPGPFVDVDEQTLDQMLALNVRAAFIVAPLVAKYVSRAAGEQ